MGTILSKQTDDEKVRAVPPLVEEDWPWIWAIRDPEILDWRCGGGGLTPDEVQAIAVKQRELPVSITDSLYLGNAYSVSDVSKLQRLGITAVLNMAGPFAVKSKTIQAYKSNGIRYRGVPAQDEFHYPLLERHWESAYQFLQETTTNGGKCAVHCVAGINRSVLIVAAFYMISTNTPVLKTMRHIRKQRGNVALQNEGFQEQLVALARKHNLLDDPAPGTPQSGIIWVPPPPKQPWEDWRNSIPANPLDRLTTSYEKIERASG